MSAVLPTYARADIAFSHGEGVYLVAENGQRYLDFGAGVAVNVLGHSHPHLVSALTEQVAKVWHVSNLFQSKGQEKLAERLCKATFAERVFFCNSGAEAMEACIKMARKYHAHKGAPERYRLITFEGAFHGRTLATLAAGNQEKHLAGFGPKVEGFDQVELGDLAATRAAITDETAGIIVEPLQGESGVRHATWPFLRALRQLCDEHGILLIFDEVQTGVGRTGRFFAYEWSGIEPDILGVAKGLGGGFPMGACLATEEAASGMTVGTHGSTFGGNPLAMAAANAVVDVVLQEEFLGNVRQTGLLLKQRLAELTDTYGDIIEEIRGEGLMIGIKCRLPNNRLLEALHRQNMLTIPAGDNVVRLLPPLIIGEQDVHDACSKIGSACAELRRQSAAQPAA
jgi:acetylornithine/N-succinyldiaminopimelate aminotransferase